jgi:hypothetical protein
MSISLKRFRVPILKILNTHVQSSNFNNMFYEAIRPLLFFDPRTILEPQLSYFFHFYRIVNDIVPISRIMQHINASDENDIPSHFRTYEPPQWENWEEIWSQPPYEINTPHIINPYIEYQFRSTLFRVNVPSTYFYLHSLSTKIIEQGTTIIFKGHNNEHARFVVQWCQWIHEHEAYLKVVGVDSTGKTFPYSDPDFPTFILVVPVCRTDVPFPSADILHEPKPFLTAEEGYQRFKAGHRDIKLCWACGGAQISDS